MSSASSSRIAHRAAEARGKPAPEPRPFNHWEKPEPPEKKWKAEAHEQLMVALRDGDLHAQGRFSETRNDRNFSPDYGRTFVMHSGHHTPISPAQWREGRWFEGRLATMFWEFIDIRTPRFMVQAIWPEPTPSPGAYTTPYLDLMQAAIAHFRLSEASQEKKDVIVDWLLTQTVDGEPISQNLADAMATLIRLPSSQRGGAKRVVGPSFSRAS